jgi:hypothetical protein
LLTIAAFIVGLVFYWFRFSRHQLKEDLDDARTRPHEWNFKAWYLRETRRNIHFMAVMAPFVAIGVLLDWAMGTALFVD